MEIHLRRAEPSDAASLATVEVISWRIAYQGLMPDAFLKSLSPEKKRASWHRTLRKHGPFGRKRVMLAYSDAGVIGFVRVGAVFEEREIGLVYLLYVHPQYWGHGVGKRLMQAAMDDLRDLEMDEAILWVLRDNQRARTFYESLGWLPDRRTKSDDYGGIELEALCYQRTVAT